MANAVADGHIDVMPDVLVTGGGGSFDGLAAQLIRFFSSGGNAPAALGAGAAAPADRAGSVEGAGDLDDGAMRDGGV